jgi:hypothetical protein
MLLTDFLIDPFPIVVCDLIEEIETIIIKDRLPFIDLIVWRLYWRLATV